MGRKSSNNYFTKAVDAAIEQYNDEDDEELRSYIYEADIYEPLDKLVENVIHRYKFHEYDWSYEVLKHDCVTYLTDRLDRFSPERGKAYSFFTVIARNYLTQRAKSTYGKKIIREELHSVDEDRDVISEMYTDYQTALLSEFVRMWSEWGLDNVMELFSKNRDRRIANALFVLFENSSDIDNYNKKALYILVREHARVKTQYITPIVNELKVMFSEMSNDYLRDGCIEWDYYLEKYRTC